MPIQVCEFDLSPGWAEGTGGQRRQVHACLRPSHPAPRQHTPASPAPPSPHSPCRSPPPSSPSAPPASPPSPTPHPLPLLLLLPLPSPVQPGG
ncbi:unnamed protein product [Closterium sp. NIES-54]